MSIVISKPSDMLRNFIVPTKNPNLHASMAITMVPRDGEMPGYIAEQFSTVYAKRLIKVVGQIQGVNVWLQRLRQRDIVCRTILQESRQYRQYIEENNVFITQEQKDAFARLPARLWISELSLPNLYTGNKHKLGDVVINASATPEQHKEGASFVLGWFPGIIQIGLEHRD